MDPTPTPLPPRVCVDASLVLHLLLYDERDLTVVDLWQEWAVRGAQVICPVLLYAEVTSVLRLRVSTGRLTPGEGDAAFAAFNALGIQRMDRDDLHVRAWTLSAHCGTRRAYDMTYLALAQLEDCELWPAVSQEYIGSMPDSSPLACGRPAPPTL